MTFVGILKALSTFFY